MFKRLVSCLLSLSIVFTTNQISYAMPDDADFLIENAIEEEEASEAAAVEGDYENDNLKGIRSIDEAGSKEDEEASEELKEVPGEENDEAPEVYASETASVSADEISGDEDSTYGYHYMPEDDVVQSIQLKPSEYERDKAALPASYIPDVDDLPKQRNQNPYGTCWAHAAMATAELSMLKQGYIADPLQADYSELALAYFGYNKVVDPLGGTKGDTIVGIPAEGETIFDIGGNRSLTPHMLAGWIGATDEAKVPYSSASDALSNGIDAKYAYDDAAHVKNALEYNIRENPELVKAAIIKNGAIDVSYYENSKYYNAANNCYYNNVNTTTNHAVTIVGYDDTFSKTNFTEQPEHDGAWLIRNSWTTLETYKWSRYSYFWISYDDTSISSKVISYEYEPADKYDNNYQYDSCAGTGTLYLGETFYSANVFKAHASSAESLKAIMFYTAYAQVDYTVDIYKLDDDYTSPIDGEKVTSASTTGSTTAPGYYTVTLADDVFLWEDDIFSVVISLHKDGDTPGVAYETDITWSWVNASVAAEEGESFYSTNGTSWRDIKTFKSSSHNIGNYRIKALTKNIAPPSVPVEDIEIEGALDEAIGIGEKLTLSANVLPKKASNKEVQWSSDSAAAVVDENGVVTGAVPGTAHITATSKADPSIKASVTVLVDNVVTSITIEGSDEYEKEDSEILSFSVYPSDAKELTKTPVWTSDDESVAVIDSDGRLTAVGSGYTDITLTIGRLKDVMTVYVYPKPVPFTISMNKSGVVDIEWDGAKDAYDYTITRTIVQKRDNSAWVNYETDPTVLDMIVADSREAYSYTDNSPELLALDDTNYHVAYSLVVSEVYESHLMESASIEYIYAGPLHSITYALPDTVISNENNQDYYRFGNTVEFNDPVVDKYCTFGGWKVYSADKSVNYGVKASTSGFDTDLVLEPVIVGNPYYIKYDGNGSTEGSMGLQLFVYGSDEVLNENAFKREGYEFIGWNTVKSGSGTEIANGAKPSSLYKGSDAPITLYAQWTPCTYSVSVNKKAGFGAAGAKKYTCDIGKHSYTETIYQLSDVKTSKSSYIYTGDEIVPEIAVKDSNGAVISEDLYTVSKIAGQEYIKPSDSKVLVTLRDNELYEGSIEVSFTIAKAVSPKEVPNNMQVEAGYKKTVSMLSLIKDWEWDEKDAQKLLPSAIGDTLTVSAEYKGADADCYVNTRITIVLTVDSCKHMPLAPVSANYVEPKCESKGSYDMVIYCNLCGSLIESKPYEIQPLGHDIVIDKAVSANCTADGKTKGSHCARCNKEIEKSQKIPALGHDYDDGEILEEAAYGNAGRIKYVCKRCSHERIDEIPALEFYSKTVTLYDKKRGDVTANITIKTADEKGNILDAVDMSNAMNNNSKKIVFAKAAAMPIVTGYTFKGFYNGEKKVSSIAPAKLCDVTLTARYCENTYNVKYTMTVPEKGLKVTRKAVNLKKVPYTKEISIDAGDITLSGYRLIGYTKVKGGSEVQYLPGQKVSGLSPAKNGKVVLYPVWEKQQ